MRRPVFYARVSSEEQRDRETIQNQLEFASRYAEMWERPWGEVYADDGVSGTGPLVERPAGARLLRDVRSGQVSQVCVYRVDRLARNLRVLLNEVHELESHGAALVSLTESFDTSAPFGRAVVAILGTFAQLERDTIVERTSAGKRRGAAGGRWQGGVVPYGYRVEGGILLEDPGGAELVRWIYTEYARETGSLWRLADQLTARGVAPPRGIRSAWGATTVRSILTNPIYRGAGLTWSGENHAGSAPALLDPDLWDRVQRRLRDNLVLATRNSDRDYLLRGLLECGTCGAGYVGSHESRRNLTYYRCNRKVTDRGVERRCPMLRQDIVEPAIWRRAVSVLLDPDPELLRLASRLEAEAAGVALDSERQERAERALAALQVQRDRLFALYRRSAIDDGALDRQLAEIEAESTTLQSALTQQTDQRARVDSARRQLDSARGLLATCSDSLDQADPALRREVLRQLIHRIRVHSRDHLEILWTWL